jgi:hypothetical protein
MSMLGIGLDSISLQMACHNSVTGLGMDWLLSQEFEQQENEFILLTGI